MAPRGLTRSSEASGDREEAVCWHRKNAVVETLCPGHHDAMEQWPPVGTIYEPLGSDDVARELRERFIERVQRELTREEREYAAACQEPTIEAGTTPAGERLLRISWAATRR